MAPALASAQAVGASTAIVIEPRLDRDDVAGARIEPAYHPRPIRIGPVLAQPALSIVGGYVSNLFNRTDAKAAAVATAMPSVILCADMPRHDLGFSATGTLRRFSRSRTENSEEFVLAADGRLDLGTRRTVKAAVEYAHLIEPRSSAGSDSDTAADPAEPASYNRLAVDAGSGFAVGRLRVAPSLRYERVDYDAVTLTGGGKADQSFRDTRSLRGEVRIDYDLSGLVSTFVAGSWEDVKSTAASALQRRDAQDRSIVAGLRGALSPVLSGEVGVGYRLRNYAAPAFRDFSGLTFRADMQWYVTPLLTLRVQASRIFRNSGNRQVGGILTDAVTLSAYYDPLRNLRLSAAARIERGDFGEVDTRTWRKGMQVQAQYRVSRGLSIGGYIGVLRQDVSGARLVNPFTAFSAGLGITVTP